MNCPKRDALIFPKLGGSCCPPHGYSPTLRKKNASVLTRIVVTMVLLCGSLLLASPQECSADIEVCFCPNGGIREQIMRRINLAKSSIDIGIFNWASKQLADSVVRAQKRGVRVKVVGDERKVQGKRSQTGYVAGKGIATKLVAGRDKGNIQNKYAIFDERLVLVDSYNWTDRAETLNCDNVMFLDDPAVVRKYQQEFARLCERR